MITENQVSKKLLIANENVKEATPESLVIKLLTFLDSIDSQKNNTLDEYSTVEKRKDSAALIKTGKELLLDLHSKEEEIKRHYTQHKIKLPTFGIKDSTTNKFHTFTLEEYAAGPSPIDRIIERIKLMLAEIMRASIHGDEVIKLLQRHVIFCIGPNKRIERWRLIDSSDQGLEEVYVKINALANNKRILNDPFIKLLQEFHEHANNKKSKKYPYRRGILESIVQTLIQSDFNSANHREFVQQYAFLDSNGQIIALKPVSLINRWHAEHQDFDRNKTTTFWYGWEQLKEFRELCKNFAKTRLEILETLGNDSLIHEFKLCHDFKKINDIATGKQPEYANELKRYQHKIFLFYSRASLISCASPNKKYSRKTISSNKASYSNESS